MDTEIEMETPDDSIKTDIEIKIEMETPDDSLLTRRRIALGPPIFDDADSESVDAYSSDDVRMFEFKEVLTTYRRFNAFQPYVPSIDTDDADSDSEAVTSRESVDAYSSDDFRMFEFKVRKCARGRSHDWTECPYAHPGEKARRRDPRKYHYSGTACPDFRNGNCKKGDACEFAHGVFECWLHPARYRTQPCKDGPSCSRRVCFFAHTPDQLRVLPQQSPDSYDGSPLRHGTESSCAKTLPFVSSPGQCLQIPYWKIWSRPLRSSLNWIISIPGSIRNVFHPSSEDLADTPLEEVLSWKSFLCFALGSVLNVPPIYAECLIFLFICSLSYQANNLTSPFDIQFGTQSGKSTDTRQSLWRFKEAFHEFFPEMAHIMKFMTCYILTLMLIWPVRPGVQILCIVVLIFAPVFYFPELARKASGVDVACGSFKLPLIWFTSLGALGLSLVCGFLILLVVYISWRFIHKGRPGVEGIQDEVVDSPETSVAIDMEASAVM